MVVKNTIIWGGNPPNPPKCVQLHSTKVGKMFWKLNYVRAEFYTVSTIETMFFNLRNVVVQQSLNITKKNDFKT